MKISDLEKQAADMEKSLGGDDGSGKEAQPVTQLSIVNKALDLLKSYMPARKAAFAGKETADEEEQEKEELEEALAQGGKGALGKSGETKQPHGRQNDLNSGEMSSSKKIPKKYNYDTNMEDTSLDLPDNTEVPYYEEKRNVRKSISDISNDPDLSDDEKVFVINEQLEKGFAEIHQSRIEQARLQKGIDTIAFAASVILSGMQKSITAQANTGRGRISMLSVVDKTAAAKSVNGEQQTGNSDISRLEFSQKLLKAQKSQRLSFNDVSMAETCMNEGLPIPQNILAAVGSE